MDYSTLKAKPVESLGRTGGRAAQPVPPSIVALLDAAASGGPQAVTLPTAEDVAAVRRLMGKAAMQRTPAVTVRTAVEPDGLTLRFEVTDRITHAPRTPEQIAATTAKRQATLDAKRKGSGDKAA